MFHYCEPTPNQVKKAATGKGNAKKDHVVSSIQAWIRGANPEMMLEIMNLSQAKREAVCDAFGVARAAAAQYAEHALREA